MRRPLSRTAVTLVALLGLAAPIAAPLAAQARPAPHKPGHGHGGGHHGGGNGGGQGHQTRLRQPAAPFGVGDPGVMYDPESGQYVMFYTGKRGSVATGPSPTGPWTEVDRPAVHATPDWASKDTESYWAPSAVRVGEHRYVLVFSAVLRGEQTRRCLGTAVSSSAAGPYTAAPRPLSCPGGQFHAPDTIPGVDRGNSIIDATPRFLVVDGKTKLYVTYKTQHTKPDGSYYSTVRMVRVNPDTNATTIVNRSHQLTVRDGNIEENPVIVQTGPSDFTLFTSLGGYTLCGYHTEWRHSSDPWHWPAASQPLAFPADTNTCGTGDADVYPDTAGGWHIYFSGHYPKQSDGFRLYQGVVGWNGTTPFVAGVA